ncbi:MAG: zinc ribbon domain-containing protein [Oscillospiraceae bacterium]|nr:zinc ribbon domain-containing protein [Oscillospiraceae bacterium]
MRGFIVIIPWWALVVFALLALAIAVLILVIVLRVRRVRQLEDVTEEVEGRPLAKRFCPYCGANVQLRDRICSNCDEEL